MLMPLVSTGRQKTDHMQHAAQWSLDMSYQHVNNSDNVQELADTFIQQI